MERKRKIIAALADLKQEIAGPIPVDIVSKWSRSAKTPQQQKIILEPFERRGYLVASDSAGLSRLSGERTLLEVMKMVSEPKEIIYLLGRKIGGEGVGVWAADNSLMFYPQEKVGAGLLLETMSAAQKQIGRGPLQVGIGLHRGTFWEIGRGMFGEEAELVEKVAEEYTAAGEIVVSETVRADWGSDQHFRLRRREDLAQIEKDFFSLNYDGMGPEHVDFPLPDPAELRAEHFYPFPFDTDFFLALKKMGRTAAGDDTEQNQKVLQSYAHRKIVLLVKVYHKSMRLLLDQLTDWVVVNAILNEMAVKYDVRTVKSNGDLAIFVADDVNEALGLAEEVLTSMAASDDRVSIGLAAGDVLLFDLEGGGSDIAGGPVNIASKISEDIAEQDSLYVDQSVVVPAHHLSRYEPYRLEKSGIVLRGLRYRSV